MASRGRKPKPTAIKLLEGNLGTHRRAVRRKPYDQPVGCRPLNRAEPKPTGVPVCPDWLEEEAKAEWERMGSILADMGVLTEVDTMAFAGYCQAYARWKEAEEFISQHGSIIRTPNGYLQL